MSSLSMGMTAEIVLSTKKNLRNLTINGEFIISKFSLDQWPRQYNRIFPASRSQYVFLAYITMLTAKSLGRGA